MGLEIIRYDRPAGNTLRQQAKRMLDVISSNNSFSLFPEAFTARWMQDEDAKAIELSRDLSTYSQSPSTIVDMNSGVSTKVTEKFSGHALLPRNIDGELITVRRTTPRTGHRVNLVSVITTDITDIARSKDMYALNANFDLQIPGLEAPTVRQVGTIIETVGRLAELHSIELDLG